MNSKYPVVAKRADHRCAYCRAPEVVFNFPFEVEHVLLSADGGKHEDSNLALSCRSCNIYKSRHTTGFDDRTGESVRLFHPREDRWSEHFEISNDLQIFGITSIGRATIHRLCLNSARQIASRRRWQILKQCP